MILITLTLYFFIATDGVKAYKRKSNKNFLLKMNLISPS